MTGAMTMALLLVQAAGAGQPSAPAAAASRMAPASTLQQAFERAVALDETGTPVARIDAWRAIAERARGNVRTVAIARAHEGMATAAAGRTEEGVALIQASLAALPAKDATLGGLRFDATFALASAAEQDFDYGAAADRFAAAEALAAAPAERMSSMIGFIRTATYTDPAAALAAVRRADGLLRTLKVEPKVTGIVRRFHAELLLNQGDYVGAKREAAAAVKAMGGLTTQTDSNDVSVRSDYAIAALLTGKEDEAREYMAMTGAGRLPDGVFGRGVDTAVPDCGGDVALKPADLAIVEFTVADDGHAVGVRPVYAAGGGGAALAFARSVSGWSWTPEQLTKVPAFFRNRIRLELRCSTAFQRPSVVAFFDRQLASWLRGRDLERPDAPAGSDAAALPAERSALTAAEAKDGQDALAIVPSLWRVAGNHVTPRDEVNADARRMLAILTANDAPPSARFAAEILVAASGHERGETVFRSLEARYAGDPQTRGALALMTADRAGGDLARARAALRPVAEDPTLSPDDPVRTAALVRLASLEERARRPEEARAIYAQAKIAPESCALIDSPPRLLHVGGTFPQEAMRWGFEGWALLQYDISAAGKVDNERAIIAYPPFVFTKAAITTMAGAQFAKTYRPDGQLGCGGNTGGVKFLLPTH